ncbi:hypothetical protein J6590_070243 [Homalodisca vitripennis]|nr:hypothetical protein J6590_070243 [Homalodisca vitripennis]
MNIRCGTFLADKKNRITDHSLQYAGSRRACALHLTYASSSNSYYEKQLTFWITLVLGSARVVKTCIKNSDTVDINLPLYFGEVSFSNTKYIPVRGRDIHSSGTRDRDKYRTGRHGTVVFEQFGFSYRRSFGI